MKNLPRLLPAFVLLAAALPSSADEGFWLFTHPPRQQLKATYNFELTDALLGSLQKASVSLGSGGSGAFVSADGLLVTNHHCVVEYLHDLSEKRDDLFTKGFYAEKREQELRCTGAELLVLWSVEDVTLRVEKAIEPGMTFAEAAKARKEILRTIEEESQDKTGLHSEVTTLYHGGKHHLYRYKKYTDVRLVFAPVESVGNWLDICFLRAYEDGKPAQTPIFLRFATEGPKIGELTLISGHPGSTDRFRTRAELEHRYGYEKYMQLKVINRFDHVLTEFAKKSPEHEKQARVDLFDIRLGRERAVNLLNVQEKELARIRDREQNDLARLAKLDAKAAKQYRDALDRIARCYKQSGATSLAYTLLENRCAFQTSLFQYARMLLRLTEESGKPADQRLAEYDKAGCKEAERVLLEPKTIVRELEIVKLADSLDFFVTNAPDADAKLVATILDGKTPAERARELIEGSQLDRLDVRKALLEGGRKAVLASNDSMLLLARLVDPRSRQLRQEAEERFQEPCDQAYATLAHIREKWLGGESYPDGTSTLRLSFGKVEPFQAASDADEGKEPQTVVRIEDVLSYLASPEKSAVAVWQMDVERPILLRHSVDSAPGNSGSPIIDRSGRLMGITARGFNAAPLGYTNGAGGRGVAAHGLIEVLDTYYKATELVQELGGNKKAERKLLPPPPPILLLPPSVPPTVPAQPSEITRSTFTGPNYTPLAPPPLPSLSPPPSIEAQLPALPAVPVARATDRPAIAERHKALIPVVVRAIKDPDAVVRESAEKWLANLRDDALPFLVEALRTRDDAIRLGPVQTSGRFGPAVGIVLSKLGSDAPDAIALLVRALDCEDVELRRLAARSLMLRVLERTTSLPSGPSPPRLADR